MYTKSKSKDGKSEIETASRVIETRVTGFGVHAAVLASALIIPVVSLVPLPVVAGVFLYLSRRVMSGNQFLARCKQVRQAREPWRQPSPPRPRLHAPPRRQLLALAPAPPWLGFLWGGLAARPRPAPGRSIWVQATPPRAPPAAWPVPLYGVRCQCL